MKLIVNADDLGESANVNSTIRHAHEMGCVTSASLMSLFNVFNDTVKLIKEIPDLGIGIHLAIDGNADDLPDGIDSLINPETGTLYEKQAVISRIRNKQIQKEHLNKMYKYQIEKVLDNNIHVTHIDHHHHLHLYFPVLQSVIKMAIRYHIPVIRSQNIIIHSNGSITKKAYRKIHQFYLKRNTSTTDGYFDIENSSFETAYYRFSQLLSTKNRCVEIVVHPKEMEDFDTLFVTHPDILKLTGKHSLINFSKLAS